MSQIQKPRGIDEGEALEAKRLYRDIRTPGQRFADWLKAGETQCYGLGGCAFGIFIIPGYANTFFLLGVFLFALRIIVCRKERLPFRMPLGTSGVDLGDPLPGRRGFAKPEGIFYLGNCKRTRKELWLKAKDILTHMLLFGTTGAGKTETLVSLTFNALATASGCFYIDPKAAPKLAVQLWQMARFLGRDDDFRVLNYGTSGKTKGKSPRRLSNTNNPFTFGSAEALTQLLVALMPPSEGGNAIFADKAQALIAGVMYALVDLRDKGLIKLSTETIRNSLTLDACVALAERPELDTQPRNALHAALATSGWLAGRPLEAQPESFPEQFGYAQSYFGKALSSLTDTYSHIYSTSDGEVDFADAIMQRRILVVMLPSLEKAPQELASLGKVSLSAIRNACAVGLGSQIEGDAGDVLEALPTDTTGIGPYLAVVDEYAAIVTPGFEVVLTQGRGLGIAAIVASQDYAGIVEADKKGAQQMVANTSIKSFMKMEDEATFKLVDELAGQSEVMRTTGYQADTNSESVVYRDNLATTVEKVGRVHKRDLQEQIEGEAHYIFRGELVRGDMFFANPSLKKAQLRVPQMLESIFYEEVV